MGTFTLLTAFTRAQTSVLEVDLDLMYEIKRTGVRTANPRVMSLSALVILAGHDVNRCSAPKSRETRCYIKVEEHVTRLQPGTFTWTQATNSSQGSSQAITFASKRRGREFQDLGHEGTMNGKLIGRLATLEPLKGAANALVTAQTTDW